MLDRWEQNPFGAKPRFEYDENDHDLPLAFMTIRQSSTPSGNSLTYYSVRTNTTGHGDEAWAVLHAMQAEGVTSRSIGRAERGSRVVFADWVKALVSQLLTNSRQGD